MFITLDTLKEKGACGPGVRYFERFYPNGAEMIDVIHDRHIHKEFLHWGRRWLDVSEEELKAYCKVCNIVDSEGFWYSQDVYNSKTVVKSKGIKDSTNVFRSIDISNSADVADSENIENSQQIFYSSMVDTSNKVIKGQNIVESTNICNAITVVRSTNVIDSNTVFDSSEIINCNMVVNSYFCQDCTNIENCMFCEDLENIEYHIFNKPVDEKMYKLFEKQYKKYLTENLSFIRDWPSEIVGNQHITPTRKFDDWYHPISEKFWKWVKTLPGYDPMFVYNITMNPDFLIQVTD